MANTQLKHIPHVESDIHEMQIVSTAVEMFWKEKNTVFYSFIANIWPEKKRNIIKLKKQLKTSVSWGREMSIRSTNC